MQPLFVLTYSVLYIGLMLQLCCASSYYYHNEAVNLLATPILLYTWS